MKWYWLVLLVLLLIEGAARAIQWFRTHRTRKREAERAMEELYPAALRAYRYVTGKEGEA